MFVASPASVIVTAVALEPASVKNFPVATFCNLKIPSEGGESCAIIDKEQNAKTKNSIDLKVYFFIYIGI